MGIEKCEKIQNEIKNYKNITESCMKSCSKLTQEIIELKKEIEKIGKKNNSNSNSNSNCKININNSNNNNKKIKINNNNKNKDGFVSNFKNINKLGNSLNRKSSLENKNKRI